MDFGKLIIPTEVKVCATCTYWDGERYHDSEMRVVVVEECADGECLVTEQNRDGLHDKRRDPNCLWEDLNADEPAENAAAMVGKPADTA